MPDGLIPVKGDFDELGDAIAIPTDGDINDGDNNDCLQLFGDRLHAFTVNGCVKFDENETFVDNFCVGDVT